MTLPNREDQFEDGPFTRRIIGCAMRVHSCLGCGFQEIIYLNSLGIELAKAKIKYAREYDMPIYNDSTQVGSRRVDFLVEHRIAVELKAAVDIENSHLAQANNYLEAYRLRIGLLINFGVESLQFKRLINSRVPRRV